MSQKDHIPIGFSNVLIENNSLIPLNGEKFIRLNRGENWNNIADIWLHEGQRYSNYILPDIQVPTVDGAQIIEPANDASWSSVKADNFPDQYACNNAMINDRSGQAYRPEEIIKYGIILCIGSDGRATMAMKILKINEDKSIIAQFLRWI